MHVLYNIASTASVYNISLGPPGSFRGRGKEPGLHCMCMHVITAEFRRDRISTVGIRSYRSGAIPVVIEWFVVCPPCYNEKADGLGVLAMLQE